MAGEQKNHFTVGIVDDVTHRSLDVGEHISTAGGSTQGVTDAMELPAGISDTYFAAISAAARQGSATVLKFNLLPSGTGSFILVLTLPGDQVVNKLIKLPLAVSEADLNLLTALLNATMTEIPVEEFTADKMEKVMRAAGAAASLVPVIVDFTTEALRRTAAADVAASYSQLLQSRVLRQTMEQNLGMPLNGTVSAQQLGETNLIRVTVTADTPRQALVLLQAVSDNYGSLSAHVSSSAVLTQLNAPSLSVSAARSYNVPRTCLIAAAAGAALTAAAVVWAAVFSGTVQTLEGARSGLDARIISSVPHEGRRTRKLLGWFDDRRRERRARRGDKRLRRNLNISSPAISFAFTESIHRIAEKFQHEHAKGRRVFLFSSVSAAEGKSTLAANTAISLASRGVSVLFIDLDLRRPVQSEMLGLSVKQKNELGTLLTESAAPEKILAAAVTDPATGLHSLLSTKSYTDVIELLASDQLAKVVALARERYDYVIIDSPPLGFFSDSELLSDLSDASVLVVRQDTVPAPEINDAIDALRAGKAEFLGCILNDMAHLTAYSAGYGYGYGYYGYGYGKKYDKYGCGHRSGQKQQ